MRNIAKSAMKNLIMTTLQRSRVGTNRRSQPVSECNHRADHAACSGQQRANRLSHLARNRLRTKPMLSDVSVVSIQGGGKSSPLQTTLGLHQQSDGCADHGSDQGIRHACHQWHVDRSSEIPVVDNPSGRLAIDKSQGMREPPRKIVSTA